MHVASAQPLFPYASKHVLSCGAFVVQEEPPKLFCRQHLGQRTRRFFELIYQHISVQPSGSPIVVNRFNPQTTSLRLPKPILIVAYKLKPPMLNFCLAILYTKASLTQRKQCLSRHKTNPIDSPQQFIFLYCKWRISYAGYLIASQNDKDQSASRRYRKIGTRCGC